MNLIIVFFATIGCLTALTLSEIASAANCLPATLSSSKNERSTEDLEKITDAVLDTSRKYVLHPQGTNVELSVHEFTTPTTGKPLVISPGFGEDCTKYAEFVFDMSDYGPIYCINHLGQSPQSIRDQIKSVNGTTYRLADSPRVDKLATDLRHLIAHVKQQNGGAKPSVFGHSMGGKIVMRAIQFPSMSELINKNVVLSAPHLGYSKTPINAKGELTGPKDAVEEAFARTCSRLSSSTSLQGLFESLSMIVGGRIGIDESTLSKLSCFKCQGSDGPLAASKPKTHQLTSSKIRGDFFYGNAKFAEYGAIPTCGTARWAGMGLLDQANIEQQMRALRSTFPTTPLILLPGMDVYADNAVAMKYQRMFPEQISTRTIDRANTANGHCQHEPIFEVKECRDQAISAMRCHFEGTR